MLNEFIYIMTNLLGSTSSASIEWLPLTMSLILKQIKWPELYVPIRA
jgi:hypothetical protein